MSKECMIYSTIFATLIWAMWYAVIAVLFPHYTLFYKCLLAFGIGTLFSVCCAIVIYFVDRKYYR